MSASPRALARIAAGLAIALTMVSVTQVSATPREQLHASGQLGTQTSLLRPAPSAQTHTGIALSFPATALLVLGEAAKAQPRPDTEIEDLKWVRPTAEVEAEPLSAPIDCSQVACVAITIDDGPGPQTRELLDQLAAAEAKATFFVVGAAVAKAPELTGEIVAAGHELGLHSHTHPRMPALGDQAIRREFERSRAAIEAAVGQQVNIYRPPYGLHSKRVGRLAEAAVIMWDVDPQDWRRGNQRGLASHVLKRVQPGSIVLLHELVPTTKALPEILAGLQAAGYHLVTVSELLGTDLVNGQVYRVGPTPLGE